MSNVPKDAQTRLWGGALRTYVLKCERVYSSLDTEEARRRYATLAIAGIFERIEHIPELKGLLSLSITRDVFDFFDDIHRGRDHPWRSLGPFGGLQHYTKTEERIRTYALIGVEILIEAAGGRRGAKKQAFTLVAEAAMSAGFELSAKRIKGLYYELQRGSFPHPRLISEFVANFWMGEAGAGSIAVCEHGSPVHRCSMSHDSRCVRIFKAAEAYLPGLFAEAEFKQTRKHRT